MITTLSTTTVIIAFLGVAVGYITQAVQTGKLLGIATVPLTWLPYLSLLATFLAASVTSISQASAPVSATAWTNAALAGLLALIGNGTGVTIHQHIQARPPENDNGTANDDAERKAA